MPAYTQKYLRKRRLITVFPLLCLPFVTLMFWAFGGGHTAKYAVKHTSGLNTLLPEPELQPDSEQNTDKLSLFELSRKEAEQRQAEQEDPAIQDQTAGLEPEAERPLYDSGTDLSGDLAPESDRQARKLRQQLTLLKAQLQNTQPPGEEANLPPAASGLPEIPPQPGEDTPDPELQQLNGMLEKILDIEHPDRVTHRLQTQSEAHRGVIYSVSLQPEMPYAELLAPPRTNMAGKDSLFQQAFFYGADRGTRDTQQENTAIPAVVPETQTLVSGATVKMRSAVPLWINGVNIPAHSLIYGACALEGERLKIIVKSIRYGTSVFPVNLSVYDTDGMEGIRIPDAISRSAAKEGAGQGIQSLDLFSMDQSLGAEAAAAGIQTAKTFLGNKIRLVQATIKSGHTVLLLDQNKSKE